MENNQTSSEVLKKEIQEQSKKEASDILEQAEREKKRILQEAREEADKILDRDDPVFEQIFQIAHSIESGHDEISRVIDRGQKLEEF